jgi:hypothetical protein
MKVSGAFVHGKWFCGEKCAESDPDTRQMKDLYENGIEFKNNEEEEGDDQEVEIDL